jgi:thiamine-monophosphate kinase
MIPGAIRRGDGRPGDLLVCTGPHGLSRLGLALLQAEHPGHGETALDADHDGELGHLDPALRQRAIQAHRRPVPRFDAVRALIGSHAARTPWRVGGCDSSDGLAAAVRAIAVASGCTARLDRKALPLDPAMASLPQAEAWCLGGGEDFELVLALEPDWAEALVAALPGATRIGRLQAGREDEPGWSDGSPWPDASSCSGGFRHFG